MGNGVSGNQGNLPSHGSRDVGDTPDRKRHEWFEQAEAPNANTPTQSGVKSYNGAQPRGLKSTEDSPRLDVKSYSVAQTRGRKLPTDDDAQLDA